MPYTYTVKEGDTLNAISQKYGFKDYKEAGVSAVPSGNFDLIRPGEQVVLGNYQQPVQFDSTADRTEFEKNSQTFADMQEEAAKASATTSATQNGEVVEGTDTTTTEKDGTPTAEDTILSETDKMVQTKTAEYQKQIADVTAELDKMKADLAQETAALIQSIEDAFDSSIALMEDSNKRLYAGKQQLGYVSGRSRYVSGVQQGILTDETQQGIARVSKLKAEKLAMIAEAKLAQNKQDIEIFNKKMDRINEINDNMQSEIVNIQKATYDRLDEMRTQAKEARDAEDAALQLAIDRSKEGAPAIASQLENYETPEEKAMFLEEYSKLTGIPMDILLTDIQEYSTAYQKAQLDMENTISLIENREKTTAISERNSDISAARYNLDAAKYEFNPTQEQKATVAKYATNNLDSDNAQKAMNDPEYFYYILSLADQEEL